MAFEWVAGLFQSDNQQTRGLSGDQAHTVALDDSNPYYNFRLRRHKAEGDLVADPGLLWYTSPYVKRRSGLGTHVSAEVGEGSTATYTDVLLILSKEDYARATGEWQQNAARALQQEFDNFCRRENFNRLHAHRPLGVRILEDGSQAMGGQTLRLQRGEFISGILPNLYTGPVRGSYPVIGVHLNLPGVWDGYQEVGRLYNDQILFTLGNHWLDNFSHPSLQQAALYRLRQYPDGSFVHVVNPDLQDQYQVTSTNQGGASVLTLATRAGVPLAYMVLAVIDPPSARPSSTPGRVGSNGSGAAANGSGAAAHASGASAQANGTPSADPTSAVTTLQPRPSSRPDIKLPTPQPSRPSALREEPGVPAIAPPMLLDEPSMTGGGPLGGKTIIPDMPMERVFTLQERGALLQKVHFSNFMLGYDVYLGARGELGTHVEAAAATFQVRRRTVSLVAHADNVVVGGRPVPPGTEVPIEGDVKIEVAGQKLEYKDLRGLQVDGWPYVGEIQRPASSTYMVWGEDYQIGRSRECRVVLPDEPRNDNIHWKPSVGDGATIRARTGEIPKSRFYTDSIMVASEHAGIDLRGEMPKAVCTARHCYVYIRRNGAVFPLFPATSPQQPKELELQPGDEMLIGNCLFYVGFTPTGEAVAPAAPAPKIDLADRLAGAVDQPDLATLESRTAPPPPSRQDRPASPALSAPAPEDLPERSGLARQGTSPRPAPITGTGAPPLDVDAPPPAPGDNDAPWRRAKDPDSTAGSLGMDGPIEIGDEDEPTVPGLVVPREAIESLAGLMVEPPGARSLPPATYGSGSKPGAVGLRPGVIEADLSVDDPGADVGSWDRDDWDEEDSAVSASAGDSGPSAAPGPETASVPTPFPDMGAEEPAAMTDDLLDLGQAQPTAEVDFPLPGSQPGEVPGTDAAAEEPSTVSSTLPPDPASAAPEVSVVPQASPTAGPFLMSELTGATPVAAPTASAPAPSSPGLRATALGQVVATDDAEAQFELGRPMHLVQVGWAVNGEVSCGNHTGCELVIPENRIAAEQSFEARTYFRLRVRGRKGHLDVLAPEEVRVDGAAPASGYDDPEAHTVEVIRRDDGGEEDFVVAIRVREDKRLPDPRARLVALVGDDPLASALLTKGMPRGTPRTLELQGLSLTLLFDGSTIQVSNYLQSYRRGEGFRPFFVQRGESRYTTAPEDGATFALSAGDRLVVGHCVYELRAE